MASERNRCCRCKWSPSAYPPSHRRPHGWLEKKWTKIKACCRSQSNLVIGEFKHLFLSPSPLTVGIISPCICIVTTQAHAHMQGTGSRFDFSFKTEPFYLLFSSFFLAFKNIICLLDRQRRERDNRKLISAGLLPYITIIGSRLS